MRFDTVHLTSQSANRFFYNLYVSGGNSNSAQREKMKRLLHKAIADELTEKQRICITRYYFQGKKEKDIADELGVAPSTVCRHLALAKKKLLHAAGYISPLI